MSKVKKQVFDNEALSKTPSSRMPKNLNITPADRIRRQKLETIWSKTRARGEARIAAKKASRKSKLPTKNIFRK